MKSARTKDPVKVLIFKDGDISRGVEVSENWLLRAGLLLLSLTAVTAVSAVLAFRVYWHSRPFTDNALAPPVTVAEPMTPPSPAISVAAPAVAPVAPAVTAAPAAATLAENLSRFVAQLPTSSQASEANRLDVASPSATWSGRSIVVRFNIQTLTAESPGARQGRFIVLVYGKSGVVTFPMETLEAAQPSRLNLRRGETYSVARFRSVRAVVDPRPGLRETTDLRAEVLLLDSELNLIVRKSIEVTGKPSSVAPARPVEPAAPSPSAEAGALPAESGDAAAEPEESSGDAP